VPAHKQKMFAHFNVSDIELPNTDYLTPRVISLPIHTEMTQEEMQYIATKFIETIEEVKAK
jgi:UDP-2-acetamido-2-deoxy-ribo-hexuluronate aminotransferase